jgi:hypothetical protein
MKLNQFLEIHNLQKALPGVKEVILDEVIYPYKEKGIQLVFVCLGTLNKPIKRSFTNPETQSAILKDYIKFLTGKSFSCLEDFDLNELKELEGSVLTIRVKRSNGGRFVDVVEIISRAV